VDDLLTIALSNAVAAAVLALVAIAVGSVYRRPALVHGLWLLVLLKLVTPPLVRIPVAWPRVSEPGPLNVIASTPDEPAEEGFSSPEPSARPEEPAIVLMLPPDTAAEPIPSIETAPARSSPAAVDPPLWLRTLLLAWLAGSLGWFGLALMRLAHFHRLLRFARRAPPALQKRTQRLSCRLGLARCPQVGLLPGRVAPMLWSVGGSPRLLLPADLLDVLGEDELDTLLVHELAHLRRCDHWVRALEFVVMGLYWWHPVVWYARRELREAEEQCCDAWVVSTLPGAGRTYATALMDTLDFLSTARPAVPPLASGLGQVTDLKRRLTMIMRGTTPRALSWPGCLAVLALGAFFLPMLPALQAQAPPSKEEREKEAITIRLEGEIAQKEVEHSKAELEKLEADLKQKMAEVAQAQARLKAAAAKAHAQAEKEKTAKELYLKAYRDAGEAKKAKAAEGGKQPMIRIEIAVPAGKDVDVKDLLKKIESVLPDQKTGRTIKVYPASGAGLDARIQIGEHVDGGTVTVPAPPTIYYRKVGEVVGPQDKRINDLEKKLEKVLHELDKLRKEMKQPRPGPTSAAPGAPQSNTAPPGVSAEAPTAPPGVSAPPPPPMAP
jgi:bla regulator protein BlaR1